MEREDLPLNDLFAQYTRSLNTTKERAIIKKDQMMNCQHLFIKLKERKVFLDFLDDYYNPSEVECVHCGLTNKYRSLEDFFRVKQLASKQYKEITIESKVFEETFKNYHPLTDDAFNLISNEALETYHPRLLYLLALIINPTGEKSELFTIMKDLNAIETTQERLCLKKYSQAEELLKRYQNPQNKVLIKKM